MRTRAASILLAAAALLLLAACGTDTRPSVAEPAAAEPTASAASTPASGSADVVREELGKTDPANAPGETLYLTRVRFAPGYRIATHSHPGTQIAYVTQGTLTFTVVRDGSVTVHDPDGGTREIGAGETAEVEEGAWFVEKEGVVHYGRNETDEEAIVLTSALLEKGEPISTPEQ